MNAVIVVTLNLYSPVWQEVTLHQLAEIKKKLPPDEYIVIVGEVVKGIGEEIDIDALANSF